MTVYMLEEAYTRLSMACKAPIVQGDVPCFTLYYRYSKFNRFNDQMMEEFPDAKLPTLPGVSLFQHIDTKFLQGRLSKLQACVLLELCRCRRPIRDVVLAQVHGRPVVTPPHSLPRCSPHQRCCRLRHLHQHDAGAVPAVRSPGCSRPPNV